MLLILDNVQPPLVRIVAGVANTVAILHQDYPTFPNVYITHAWDGEHKVGSLHKKYAAVDIRTKNLTREEQQLLFDRLKVKFPIPRFDVLFEDRDQSNQHIHIEDNRALLLDKEVTHEAPDISDPS